MERLTLTRLESGDQGTFGRITAKGVSFFTGELPWRDNRNDVSCIPPGLYACRWTYSPRFKRNVYLIDGVPGRFGVRIHSANLMGANPPHRCQLNGCLALGERMGWIDGQKAVLLSKPAVRRFESLMGGENFDLEVKNVG